VVDCVQSLTCVDFSFNVKVFLTEFCCSVDTAESDVSLTRFGAGRRSLTAGASPISKVTCRYTGHKVDRCAVEMGSKQICQHKTLLIKRFFSVLLHLLLTAVHNNVIIYADDILLISSSICELQRIFDFVNANLYGSILLLM